MKEQTVEFETDETGIRNMAIFIAQLVRECVTYKVVNHNEKYYVELTGGF